MRYRLAILALLLLLSAGCARVVKLYPIDKTDIFRVQKGTQVGNVTAEKDGYFLSDTYIKEVARAKVGG